MDSSKRILINAISQYVRIGLCILMNLYSTRIILGVLGHNDFGIYSLIGNVVMVISFITTSLAVSTQRFLSYSWGQDAKNVKKIFTNAFLLHLFIGLVISIALFGLKSIIIHNLNITPDRIEAAGFVFYSVTIITFITFLTAPVKALFIARENIVYTSVIEILDGAIKLVGAFALTWITIDTLKAYALIVVSISVISFLAFAVYALIHFEECQLFRMSELSWTCCKKMFDFAIWNVLAVGSTIIRTQGLAVVLNKFFGSIINAAYGITLQVSSAVSYITGAIINSMNPQLMKAEGGGDRNRMLYLATIESKYSLLVLGTLLIPVLIELPEILTFWLKEYPPYTLEFSRLIIISIIQDQITIGLNSACQAIGKIRNYSLITSTIRLLILPAAWIALKTGYGATSVMVVYLSFDIICGVSRIPLLKHLAGLQVSHYLKEVVAKSIIPFIGCMVVCMVIARILVFSGRFVVTEITGIVVSSILIYIISLDVEEKMWVNSKIKSVFTARK